MLPPPRHPDRYRIAFVCLGNICRSPTAAVVVSSLIQDAGLADRFEVTSCGTADWHTGKPMDARSANVLAEAGYDPSAHRASTFGPAWFDHDLILAMDATNLADIRASAPAAIHGRTELFRKFDPHHDGVGDPPGVPDPYYGDADGFTTVLAMVERTGRALLTELSRLL